MIFEDNRELNRQGVYNAPDQASGARKAMLAALGYKGSGEANTWGKIMNMNPLGVGSIGRNMLAGGIAGKGNDVNTVIKGQRDEAFADSMAGLKLGIEGAKLASGMGVGGAGMSSVANFGSGIMKGMSGDWGGAAMSTVAGLNNVVDMNKTKDALDKDLEELNTDEILNKANQELDENGNPIKKLDEFGNPISVSTEDYISSPDALSSNKPGSGLENTMNSVNKVAGAIPLIGGVAGALGEGIVTGSALNNAGTEELDKIKKNSVRQTAFSLN